VIADLSGAQIYAMKTGYTNYDEADEKYTDEQIIEFNRKRQQYYLNIRKESTKDGSLNTYIIHYALKYYYDEITFEELRAYVKSLIEEVQSGIIPDLH
ncbi:MAG: hypothetical protein FWF03_02835, partial [Defluviitaleaceae bacterium]|nr:hypothetical protein [Defluviitaleaceae bacterium]